MEFNKAYNRNELVKFLRTSFLPEDFIQEETPLANPKQFQYTQQVTRLGVCNTLELVVFEVLHSSVSDARVGLTKEAFRMLADEFCERALVFFVPQDDKSNYRFSLIEITLNYEDGSSRVSRIDGCASFDLPDFTEEPDNESSPTFYLYAIVGSCESRAQSQACLRYAEMKQRSRRQAANTACIPTLSTDEKRADKAHRNINRQVTPSIYIGVIVVT